MELEQIVQRVMVASAKWHCDVTLRGFADVERLAQGLHAVARKLKEGQEAGSGRADLPHFAFAVAYELDYLVTWNCQHIANGEIIRKLVDANTKLSLFTPLIVTPEEILAAPDEDET